MNTNLFNFFRKIKFMKSGIKLSLMSIPFFYFVNYRKKIYSDDNDKNLTEKIRGEYENRLRIFSPIEKRYTIFGKIKSSDQEMNYFQFFESLIPYQGVPMENQDEFQNFLNSHTEFKEILSKVDTNEDRKISYDEYLTLCFLSSSKFLIKLI